MAEYKVVLEIQVDAESPLEAAGIVQSWMKEPGASWEFIVQMDDDNQTPIYLVAPEEEEGDAVLQLNYYEPLIKT